MDIFVRGLTILISDYLETGFKQDERLTVSDFLIGNLNKNSMDISIENLSIYRFFECDVLLACNNISAPLEYDNAKLSSLNFVSSTLENLLVILKKEYDVILIDNRASLDSIIMASCDSSDFVISVAEDDNLCLQTNSNLVNHLRFKEEFKKIYTIINKGRKIINYNDLEKEKTRRPEFNYIGIIPFDMEILEDFGTYRFWDTVFETLYFRAFIDAWNTLANMENVIKLNLDRYQFPPKIFMSKKEGRYTTIERMLRFYSIAAIFMGLYVLIYRNIERFNTMDLLSYLLILIGVIMFILSSFGFRRFLLLDSK